MVSDEHKKQALAIVLSDPDLIARVIASDTKAEIARTANTYGLTAQQAHLLRFVQRYTKTRMHSPTYQEIADALDLASKSGVHRMLHDLVQRKWIRLMPNSARSIQLLGEVV